MTHPASNMQWSPFFPADTRVLALPGWKAPRLLMPAGDPCQRWKRSAFFPAFRLRGRVYRFALRAFATMPLSPVVRTITNSNWSLGRFIEDVLPEAVSVSVLVGSPGFTQKITVEVRDGREAIIGYLKYAEKPKALDRLRAEFRVLTQLPADLGPAVLKYGKWNGGEALLTMPIVGQAVPVSLPPPASAVSFCKQLEVASPVELARHPWIVRYRERVGGEPDAWLARLTRRPWPVVIQHGDLAWNLLHTHDNRVNAFDWEYGTVHGFPGIDLASYVLQAAYMIYGWAPRRTRAFAVDVLREQIGLDVSSDEADALVCLAAYNLFQYQWDEGWKWDAPLQQWRRELWGGG